MENKRFIDQINVKKIIIILSIIWGIIAIIGIGFIIFTHDKVLVDVEYAPFSATVKLNGTTVMNHHGNYLEPGEYTLEVEFENFQKIEKTISIDDQTKTIYGSLIPINADGEQYVRDHINDFLYIEGIASGQSLENGLKQSEEYPIVDKLPIKDPYYTLGYNFTEDGILNLTVESSISYRQIASQKVIELMGDDGFGRYDVSYYNLDNPYFGTFKANQETDPIKYLQTGYAVTGLDFTVQRCTREGDYYYAFLRYQFRTYTSVIYRVVLIWEDGWRLASTPYPLLTTTNTPDVPLEIINKVNKL